MDDNIKKSYDRITERYHNALRALVDSEKSDQAINHDHNETLLLMMQKYLDEGWGSTMEQLMIKPLIVAIRDKIELEVDNKFLQQQVRALKEDLKEAMPVIKALNNKIRALEGKTDNDHGDVIPAPKCGSCGVPWIDHMGIMGVCLWNKALKEDLKDCLEAHDEMKLEIDQLRTERDAARRMACQVGLSDEHGLLMYGRDCALYFGWDYFNEKKHNKQ